MNRDSRLGLALGCDDLDEDRNEGIQRDDILDRVWYEPMGGRDEFNGSVFSSKGVLRSDENADEVEATGGAGIREGDRELERVRVGGGERGGDGERRD